MIALTAIPPATPPLRIFARLLAYPLDAVRGIHRMLALAEHDDVVRHIAVAEGGLWREHPTHRAAERLKAQRTHGD